MSENQVGEGFTIPELDMDKLEVPEEKPKRPTISPRVVRGNLPKKVEEQPQDAPPAEESELSDEERAELEEKQKNAAKQPEKINQLWGPLDDVLRFSVGITGLAAKGAVFAGKGAYKGAHAGADLSKEYFASRLEAKQLDRIGRTLGRIEQREKRFQTVSEKGSQQYFDVWNQVKERMSEPDFLKRVPKGIPPQMLAWHEIGEEDPKARKLTLKRSESFLNKLDKLGTEQHRDLRRLKHMHPSIQKLHPGLQERLGLVVERNLGKDNMFEKIAEFNDKSLTPKEGLSKKMKDSLEDLKKALEKTLEFIQRLVAKFIPGMN